MLIRLTLLSALLSGFMWLQPTTVLGQYGERGELFGSGDAAVDVSGRSVKNKRVRAIHSTDPTLEGGTAYFLARDPFLAYQLGRNLNFREFRDRDGVFSDIANLGGPMPDGTTAKITANNHTSCSGCHNLPQGNPGGGTNFHKDSGFGRNAPHYYGAGLMEMLAIQIRTEMMLQIDTDQNGWVSPAEANDAPEDLLVSPAVGLDPVNFGHPQLSNRTTGRPELNNIFRVWFVDASGVTVSGATEVDGVNTFGYNFAMVVWGWGQGEGRSALNPTNRTFYWDPMIAHTGMDSHDPSTLNDPDGDGVSVPTLSGAIQFPATHRAPDQGLSMDPLGFSRDDPDGDGFLHEISEGDLDLAEWFMLNAPRPAFAGDPRDYDLGVRAMKEVGCATCHVPNWKIHAQDSNFAGDRRFFDLETEWNATKRRLEGSLVPLYEIQGEDYVLDREEFIVEGLFTDFKHHDLGDGFAEIDFGGTTNRLWRTAPLWGVGDGYPWGHDGRSLTIEDAIQRHGGDAAFSRIAYNKASESTRRQIMTLLTNMRLYDIESLPSDIDGDGQISDSYVVQGQDTGIERFNAEWLFRVPVEIQGPVISNGETILSNAAVNLDEAYGQLLPLRIDSDNDGWPNVWDHAPMVTGYQDGEN